MSWKVPVKGGKEEDRTVCMAGRTDRTNKNRKLTWRNRRSLWYTAIKIQVDQQEEVNTCIPLLLLKNRNQDDSQWKVAPLKLQMIKAASSRINRFPTVPSKIVASLQRHVS